VGTLDDYSEVLSMSLARAMTLRDDVVWIASEITVQDDLADGALCALPFATKGTEESIGILWRNDTVPTPPEQTLISAMREAARVRYGVPGLR
jgi:LysR family pca operon transcriptional activator